MRGDRREQQTLSRLAGAAFELSCAERHNRKRAGAEPLRFLPGVGVSPTSKALVPEGRSGGKENPKRIFLSIACKS